MDNKIQYRPLENINDSNINVESLITEQTPDFSSTQNNFEEDKAYQKYMEFQYQQQLKHEQNNQEDDKQQYNYDYSSQTYQNEIDKLNPDHTQKIDFVSRFNQQFTYNSYYPSPSDTRDYEFSVNSNVITKEKSTSLNFILLSNELDLQQSHQIKIKILKLEYDQYFGICLKNQLKFEDNYFPKLTTGGGIYVIGTNGNHINDAYSQFNDQPTGFVIQEGDELNIQFFAQLEVLRVINKTKGTLIDRPVKIDRNDYNFKISFCWGTYYNKNKIEISSQ